jgi:hypothetical protein
LVSVLLKTLGSQALFTGVRGIRILGRSYPRS